jgi:hypothetical protein
MQPQHQRAVAKSPQPFQDFTNVTLELKPMGGPPDIDAALDYVDDEELERDTIPSPPPCL